MRPLEPKLYFLILFLTKKNNGSLKKCLKIKIRQSNNKNLTPDLEGNDQNYFGEFCHIRRQSIYQRMLDMPKGLSN